MGIEIGGVEILSTLLENEYRISVLDEKVIARIHHFVDHYNQNCKPFVWTATAESILAKLQRLCAGISGTAH